MDVRPRKKLSCQQGKERMLYMLAWGGVGILLFAELFIIGFCLNDRFGQYLYLETVKSQKTTSISSADTIPSPIKVRSVDEIMGDFSDSYDEEQQENDLPHTDQQDDLRPLDDLVKGESMSNSSGMISTGNDEIDQLIKEARTYQVEGDMRKAILKLEEALAKSPDHPAVLYYYGISYELLNNADKAREYYLRVYQQREKSGPFYAMAAKKLESGFSSSEDMRGKVSFGVVKVFKDASCLTGEKVVVTLPVTLAPGTTIRPEDLYIPIQFYDLVNQKEIAKTRSETPKIEWLNSEVNWANGEEILQVTYYLPELTAEDVMALGDIHYYGFTAKLYYKNEPMDCYSSPRSLLLVEQNLKDKEKESDYGNVGESLLPPIEAEQVSDTDLPYILDNQKAE